MKVKFSGDFAKLKRFEQQIAAAGSPGMLKTINEQLAEEALDLVKDGFETSTDPSGHPWPPPELRNGRPLEDNGHLKASWHRKMATRHRFVIASSRQYAIYHQQGTGLYGPRRQRIVPIRAKALRLPDGTLRRSVKGAVPRKMVPDAGALPARWSQRFEETAEEALSLLFERGKKTA